MPEQPPDPLHYEMKIPSKPDPKKPHGPEETQSDEKQNESNAARDTKMVRDQEQSGGGEK